jgi:hypothetical protein
LQSKNVLTVTGGATIGGTVRAEGLVQTGEIKAIGLLANDGVQINNKEGNMIAKFYNDYRTTLNGATDILGNLYCSHPIDAYRHTATEIRARDNTGLVLGADDSTQSIKILDNSDVEILGTLKIKSFSTVIDNGLSIGAAQSANAFGLTVSNSAFVNNNLTVTNNLNITSGTLTCNNIIGLWKPFIAFKMNADGTIAANLGQVPNSAITTVVGTNNSYTINFTTAHPLGDNYAVYATPRTTAASNAFVTCTCNQSSNIITVWCRGITNNILLQNFYLHSVP